MHFQYFSTACVIDEIPFCSASPKTPAWRWTGSFWAAEWTGSRWHWTHCQRSDSVHAL